MLYLPLSVIMVDDSFPPSLREKNAQQPVDIFLYGKAALLAPSAPHPWNIKAKPQFKLQAHFGIAMLPLDPVITARTRNQHYYSSNRTIIIPQNTSKRQLKFQGKYENSWIMH